MRVARFAATARRSLRDGFSRPVVFASWVTVINNIVIKSSPYFVSIPRDSWTPYYGVGIWDGFLIVRRNEFQHGVHVQQQKHCETGTQSIRSKVRRRNEMAELSGKAATLAHRHAVVIARFRYRHTHRGGAVRRFKPHREAT